MYQIAQLIATLVNFYETLIFLYIVMRWFPLRPGGLAYDIASVLASVCEPWLGIFRRFIPPFGGLDFSYGFACGFGATVREVGDRIFMVLPAGCEIKESDLEKLRTQGFLK